MEGLRTDTGTQESEVAKSPVQLDVSVVLGSDFFGCVFKMI